MPDPRDNRRAVGRAGIEKGALLFFKGQIGARGCNVIDISDGGAKLRTHNLWCLHLRADLRQFSNYPTVPPNLARRRFPRRRIRRLEGFASSHELDV